MKFISVLSKIVCLGSIAVFLLGSILWAALTPDPHIQSDFKKVFAKPTRVQGYPYQTLIAAAAAKYGLSVPFVLALVRGESFFDATAKSSKGALGLMQVMPGTAAEYGVAAGDLLNPAINVEVGVHYLADLYKKFDDPYLALAAYYCGPGGVDKETFEIREDCNEYVRYIHSHLKKVVSKPVMTDATEKAKPQPFHLTQFDNFIDAQKFIRLLATRLPAFDFDIRRHEAVMADHTRYQYEIKVEASKGMSRRGVCKQLQTATGFALCE